MKIFNTIFIEKGHAFYSLPLLLMFLIAYLSIPAPATAWVHSGDLVLANQTALDTLTSDLTEVTGTLTIGNKSSETDITDISKLDSLKTIGSDLEIFYTKLTNLSSLSQLATIGDSALIQDNTNLTTIGNMSSLASVGDSFHIVHNIVLENISKFAGLTSIPSYLIVSNNPLLENIDGFEKLTNLGIISVLLNPKLQNLNGLAGVNAITEITIAVNAQLAEFCGIYNMVENSPLATLAIVSNAENPTREQILWDCTPCTINVTVWYDKNENGTVDADEKGLPDVTVRLSLPEGNSKHNTNNRGFTVFNGLQNGVNEICVDLSTLPADAFCTTGNTCISKLANKAHQMENIHFGFSGDALEAFAQDYVVEQKDEFIQPDGLFFVSGSPVYESGKYDYGWDNLVDGTVDPDTGSTWAAVDTQVEKPWGIFEFCDKDLYKFNYIKFQTGNGKVSKMAYQAQQIQVLCSTTSTADADFNSAGVFTCTYGTDKMHWIKLPDYVTAKYIKVCLLSPIVSGKHVQIVEFDVDTNMKNGPLPATQNENVVKIPQAHVLLSNYPNPFNPATTIVYQVKEDAHVSLKVYDVIGKQVAELVNNNQPAGEYHLTWFAGNQPSGVYFVAMQTGTEKATRRILLMK